MNFHSRLVGALEAATFALAVLTVAAPFVLADPARGGAAMRPAAESAAVVAEYATAQVVPV